MIINYVRFVSSLSLIRNDRWFDLFGLFGLFGSFSSFSSFSSFVSSHFIWSISLMTTKAYICNAPILVFYGSFFSFPLLNTITIPKQDVFKINWSKSVKLVFENVRMRFLMSIFCSGISKEIFDVKFLPWETKEMKFQAITTRTCTARWPQSSQSYPNGLSLHRHVPCHFKTSNGSPNEWNFIRCCFWFN